MVETTAIVAVIVGVVEIFKGVGLPSKYAPLLSLFLGLLASLGFDGFSTLSVFTGVLYGLTASGLYSGVKTTLK